MTTTPPKKRFRKLSRNLAALLLVALALVTATAANAQVSFAGAQTTLLASGLYHPFGLAVDSSGNVYAADTNNNAVKEIVAAGGYTTIKTLGINTPQAVAVDGSGNVFVADTSHNRIVEVQRQSVNFGRVNNGSSASLTLTYNLAASETLGTTNVLQLSHRGGARRARECLRCR